MPRLRLSEILSALASRRRATEPTTALIYKAAKSGQYAKLEALLLKTLDVSDRRSLIDAEDSKGRTPLVVSVIHGHIDCVSLLLSYGADVHYMGWNPKGGTPLHEAITSWVPNNVVKLLLQNGASPFVENVSGITPYEAAARRRDGLLSRELESRGRFSGFMLIKVLDGQCNELTWIRRWVAVIPRYANSRSSGERSYLSSSLLVFEDTSHVEPEFQLNIDCFGAALRRSEDVGTEVAITIQPEYTSVVKKYLVFESEKGRLIMSAAVTDLTLFVKATRDQNGRIDAMGHLADEVPFCDDDGIIARRLQEEYDADWARDGAPLHRPTESSDGAGPSTSGTWQLDDRILNALNEEANGLLGSSSQTDSRIISREQEDLCIVCLDAPKSAGFAHGNSVHWCVCQSCAKQMWTSGNHLCPLCRLHVDNIITDFYAT